MHYYCYQIILRVQLFYKNRSGANCSQGIYHWGAGLAGTGQMRDTGQKVLLFKQNVVATLLLPHFLPCYTPRGGPY